MSIRKKLTKDDIEELVDELAEGFNPFDIRDALMEHNDISQKEANKVMVIWARDIIKVFKA